MIADQEQIALAITASKNTSAIRETAQEVDQLGAAANRVRAETAGLGASATAAAAGVQRVSPAARSAASGVALLAQAAVTSQGSIAGVANAAGLAAQSVAMMATSARVAAAASGIGALITVAAVLVGIFIKLNQEATASQRVLDHIANISSKSAAEHELEMLKEKAEAATAAAGAAADIADRLELSNPIAATYLRIKASRDQKQALADYEAGVKKLLPVIQSFDETERERQTALAKSFRETSAAMRAQGDEAQLHLAGVLQQTGRSAVDNATAEKLLAAQHAFEAQQQQIRDQYTLTAEQQRKGISLTRTELTQRDQLLQTARENYAVTRATIEAEAAMQKNLAALALIDETRSLNAGTVAEQYEAQLQLIERAKDEAILKQGVPREVAEANAQAKIRKLRKDTLTQSLADLRTLSDATLDSQSRTVRGLGTFADSMRKLIIGAEAADAAVKSAKQFALVPASLAVGDFKGAALHAASGVQLAAAAALGFKEALGGGSSASGGGAGSGPSTESTFEPVGNAAGGGLTINLITKDPYGREAISQTIYELGRSQVLKRPIPIAPTTGLLVAGAH